MHATTTQDRCNVYTKPVAPYTVKKTVPLRTIELESYQDFGNHSTARGWTCEGPNRER